VAKVPKTEHMLLSGTADYVLDQATLRSEIGFKTISYQVLRETDGLVHYCLMVRPTQSRGVRAKTSDKPTNKPRAVPRGVRRRTRGRKVTDGRMPR
jgi:hypothetical protein